MCCSTTLAQPVYDSGAREGVEDVHTQILVLVGMCGSEPLPLGMMQRLKGGSICERVDV